MKTCSIKDSTKIVESKLKSTDKRSQKAFILIREKLKSASKTVIERAKKSPNQKQK